MLELLNDLVLAFKKVAIVIWIFGLVGFLIVASYMIKNRDIIEYYNSGNYCFQNGWYDIAEADYKGILAMHPSKKKQCSIRINYALAIVTPMTLDNIVEEYETLDEAIERLESAKDILTKDGCAHDNDDLGHNKKAQQLKNEIDDYIEELKQLAMSAGASGTPDTKEAEKQKEEDEKQESLRATFENLQEEGTKERNREIQYYDPSAEFTFSFNPKW